MIAKTGVHMCWNVPKIKMLNMKRFRTMVGLWKLDVTCIARLRNVEEHGSARTVFFIIFKILV